MTTAELRHCHDPVLHQPSQANGAASSSMRMAAPGHSRRFAPPSIASGLPQTTDIFASSRLCLKRAKARSRCDRASQLRPPGRGRRSPASRSRWLRGPACTGGGHAKSTARGSAKRPPGEPRGPQSPQFLVAAPVSILTRLRLSAERAQRYMLGVGLGVMGYRALQRLSPSPIGMVFAIEAARCLEAVGSPSL